MENTGKGIVLPFVKPSPGRVRKTRDEELDQHLKQANEECIKGLEFVLDLAKEGRISGLVVSWCEGWPHESSWVIAGRAARIREQGYFLAMRTADGILHRKD